MSFSNATVSSVRECIKLGLVFRTKTCPKRPEMRRNKERNPMRLQTQSEFKGSDHKAVQKSSRRLINSLQSLMGD